MSTGREAWLCVVEDADGNEETELVTIERNGDGARDRADERCSGDVHTPGEREQECRRQGGGVANGIPLGTRQEGRQPYQRDQKERRARRPAS
jgi:hypothetical protein